MDGKWIWRVDLESGAVPDLTQVYRCRHNLAPLYLANDLHWTDESEALQRLRSAAHQRLMVPQTRLRTIGDRAFGVAASRV